MPQYYRFNKRINWVALSILMVGFIAAGVSIHFIHDYQVRRNAGGLLIEADRAERENNPTLAIEFLHNYVRLVPEDLDSRARFALSILKNAKQRRDFSWAYFELTAYLKLDRHREDIKREAARLGVALGKFTETREYLDELLALHDQDSELLTLRARCAVAARKTDDAKEYYEKAGSFAKSDIALALERAGFLRNSLNSQEEANEVIAELVRTNANSTPAKLAAGTYFMRFGLVEQAEKLLTTDAGEPLSADVEVLVLCAEIAKAKSQLAIARKRLEAGATQYPTNSFFAIELALLDASEGRREQAITRVDRMMTSPPEQPNLLWKLADLLCSLDREKQALELCRVLEQVENGKWKWGAEWVRGKIQMRQGEWLQARETFERCLKENLPASSQPLVHLFLADCHAKTGNPDRQVRECQLALLNNPSWLQGRRALATALAAVGDIDQSANILKELTGEAPETKLEAARLQFTRMLKLPGAERRWEDLETAIANIPPMFKPGAEMLRAEIFLARGKTEEARKIALAERERNAKNHTPWIVLIAVAEIMQDGKIAELIRDAEAKTGARSEWVIAKARLALKQTGETRQATLTGLETEASKLSGAERDRSFMALGEAYAAIGDLAGAERLWSNVAKSASKDPAVAFRLFALAATRGDESAARERIKMISLAEGPDGPLAAFAEASLLAVAARKGDKQALQNARQILAKATVERPSWTLAAELDAEFAELAGDKLNAVSKYESLVTTGRTSANSVRRLVALLAEFGRHADAQAILARLPEQTIQAGGFERMAAELTLLKAADMPAQDGVATRKLGLETARKLVKQDSKDYRDYLWLGQIAAQTGELAEAEKSLRKAKELRKDDPEVWIALISLLSRTDKKQAELEITAAKNTVSAERLPEVLAVAHEVMGRVKEAGEQYQEITKSKPNDPQALGNLASFQLRVGDLAGAEKTLRQLMALGSKLPPEVAIRTRRNLAVALVSIGGFDRVKEAIALAEENVKDPKATSEDQWTMAVVLASQPGRRQESIALIENSPASMPPHVRLLLARLYERNGQWQQALDQLTRLLRINDQNPSCLMLAAKILLDHQKANEAEPMIARLLKVTGETMTTVELQARLLNERKQSREIVKLVSEFAKAKGPRAVLGGAALFEKLGLNDEAERMYRNFAADSGEPLAPLVFAEFLARHERLADAMTIYEKSWKTLPAEAVSRGCIAAMRVGKPSEADLKRIEQWLDTAISKTPESTNLLLQRADLYQVREQFIEASELYRKILAKDPRNVIALNNLAFLTAMRDGPIEEALKLIESGLAITGPHPELLDTRAAILTRANRPEEAIADLQRAIADSPDNLKHFHLAVAQSKSNRKSTAKETFETARSAGLKFADLHPLERNEWGGLVEESLKR